VTSWTTSISQSLAEQTQALSNKHHVSLQPILIIGLYLSYGIYTQYCYFNLATPFSAVQWWPSNLLKSKFLVLIILSAPKKDVSERVDRNMWKAMTNAMNDSTKFMDMLHNVQWEDGLSPDVLNGRFFGALKGGVLSKL
jgi:hypothetical protein